jgi:hypothetical protein
MMEFGEDVMDSIWASDRLGWSACHVMLRVGNFLKMVLVCWRPITLILVFVVYFVGAIVGRNLRTPASAWSRRARRLHESLDSGSTQARERTIRGHIWGIVGRGVLNLLLITFGMERVVALVGIFGRVHGCLLFWVLSSSDEDIECVGACDASK